MQPLSETKRQKDFTGIGMEDAAMPQAVESHGSNGASRPSKRLWDVTPLPDAEHARLWEKILRAKSDKLTLRSFALHTKDLADHCIPRSEVDQSGVILLCGPPGVGKTTLAGGFANEYAKIQGQLTRLVALDTKRLFSEFLGQSAKELGKAFEGLRIIAEQSPVVMVIDEIETISYARNKVINTSDPTDLVRFVDQLLKEIDSLQEYPQAVVVGTSNFSDVIDEAFWSRADLVLQMCLPDLQTRQAILQARLKTLSPLGLMLQSDEVLALAKATEGLSGRTLGKLFPRTYFEKGVSYEEMSVDDVLATITNTQRKEESNASC
jgi:pachytene checkpoint protein 2